MHSTKSYKIIDLFFKKLSSKDTPYFFKGKLANPLKIIAISADFSKLKIKDEDLLLLYSSKKDSNDFDFVITSKHIHTKNNTYLLGITALKNDEFLSFDEEHLSLIRNLVSDLGVSVNEEKKNLASFTDKFKRFVNQKESSATNFDIDASFLEILKNEGDKIQNLADDLNNNKRFSTVINDIVTKTDDAVKFTAEHIILQDIIKLFNKVCNLISEENKTATLRIKFLLAFLFEKLQGKDIISSLSIARINEFVASDSFDKNIEIIKEATLFDLGDTYKNEFLLPLILKRLKNPHFSNSAAFLYRIASLIAKADGTVSEEEQEILKKINDKLQHPKEKLQGVKEVEIDENETLEEVLEELNQLVGLDNIKGAITELSNFLKVQKLREAEGLKSVNNSLHSVFMGPPGTGKTTVARLISKIYKHLGYLEKGHLIETDRSGMVAGYVGQTALKVEEIVTASLNGVLFIDEAYALAKDAKKDFGNEAIEVLLKKMEDHRKELVVIVAGYPDEMKSFINSNPGLQSRFNRYFTFDHYKPTELVAIFELFCKKNDFVLAADAKEKLLFIFEKLYEKKDKNFGNARVARNLFEKIIEYQANRIIAIAPITKELLITIVEQDIPPVNKTVEKYLMFQEAEEVL
ncbi:AAA family ATPase [Tenacibaculum finnmarkense]|uniref:AAA family ATPase n=2 Tax=Tenacibaculum TaxID=104267 RepID=A0AAP1RGW3_9FLAO|nr:AAA family ATPase [Tenacibaculum finnmarkense]MBE7653785.1 AAA family ATPase [Tenacibaculum finnmarkense genomovar finnmarkense]MBE7696080.1 AAA family ATPase [Tenacibaculum finnmarkense genomovar finnmarkense]MCD8428298.1 AAA family ATPase [Tenacibaculum finnmarkense genomovar finnmarkense]MCG8732058.1 AAA family ATPase [Tenacibaculum finnmarkense]MCG8752427.1 AAA family ATPase [Tenacibaculum finnmarkense]